MTRVHIPAAVALLCLMVGAGPVAAQDFVFSLGDGASMTRTTLQLIAVVTVLSLAPGILIMVTCFPFVVTVLAILRQAIGLQQSPPNMLIVSLALFITYFVMEPVFIAAWQQGILPLLQEDIGIEEGVSQSLEPFRAFMLQRADPETLSALQDMRGDATDGAPALSVLVPGFMLSEISRAFQVGFLVFLPFLIIDLVVAAVLMSMGMMMVPPAIVSLPFKLAFFVISDGWVMITGSLVQSYL